MRRQTKRKMLIFLLMVGLTVIIGQIFTYLVHDTPDSVVMSHALFSWTLGGALGWGFEIYLMPGRYGAPIRRLGFLSAILVNAATITAIVVFTTLAENLLLHGGILPGMFTSQLFYLVLLVVFVSFTTLNSLLQVIRIIGGRVLANFILGRYHHPVREERIFLFLDIKGSTAMAEELGDVGVQKLISRFFFDISDPIAEHDGEVHRYIGDQVVVTWPLNRPDSILKTLKCYFAIRTLTDKRNPGYRREFGATIDFRVGIHGGPVVASECGDRKQEIVYFGNTINTAARIEQYCKQADSPFLVSAELLDQTELPPGWSRELKAVTQLRGHQHEMSLCVVSTP